MKVFAALAGWIVLAVVCQAATARVMLIRYVGVKPGAFMGKPAMILSGTPIGGGAAVHLAIWNGPVFGMPAPVVTTNPASRPALKTDRPIATPAIMTVLQNSNPGDCLRVAVVGIGARSRAMQVQPYELKPGEDDPNVYFYVDKGQEKIGDTFRKTVTFSRFGENISMMVPTVDREPSAEVMQVIESATANQTMMEITTVKIGPNLTIKTAKVYEPPKEFIFMRVATQKDLTAIEVKDGDKTQTLAVNPKAANAAVLLKRVKDFKTDQAVLVRSTSDEGGTWLLDIKPSEAKRSPTSRPQTNPVSKPG